MTPGKGRNSLDAAEHFWPVGYLEYGAYSPFNVVVFDRSGREIWSLNGHGEAVFSIAASKTLQPGESWGQSLEWDVNDNDSDPLAASESDHYWLQAWMSYSESSGSKRGPFILLATEPVAIFVQPASCTRLGLTLEGRCASGRLGAC